MLRAATFMLALVTASALALSCAGPSAQARPALSVDQLAERFDGVIGITGPTTTRFEHASGIADAARGAPHVVDEVWPIASVTKQVTALLVMQEVERGHLDLDAPITRYLPAFDGPTGPRVTPRHLLLHLSGLPNPEDTPRDERGVPSFYGSEENLAFCAGKPREEPGGSFVYDNCDYLLLGAILAEVTHTPFETLVTSRLRLFETRPSAVVGTLQGRPAPAPDLPRYGASGALTGTLAELLAFDRGLLGRRWLPDARTREMWLGRADRGHVALGAWSFDAELRGCEAPVRLVERRGEIAGVQARNILAIDRGIAVVALTNRGDFDFGEIWQGRGYAYDLASAAFCASP